MLEIKADLDEPMLEKKIEKKKKKKVDVVQLKEIDWDKLNS